MMEITFNGIPFTLNDGHIVAHQSRYSTLAQSLERHVGLFGQTRERYYPDRNELVTSAIATIGTVVVTSKGKPSPYDSNVLY